MNEDLKEFVYWTAIGIVAAVIFLLIAGCQDRYRYECQNPDNFYKEQCQRPRCQFTQTCPDYLVAPIQEKPIGTEPPPHR